MWLPHLADVAWMTQHLSRHVAALGLPEPVVTVELIDARLTHPHRPESPRCRGWATYLVTSRDAAPVQLYVKGYPSGDASESAWQQDRLTRPWGRSTHLPELDLVVWRFPEDPRLAALPDLVTPRWGAGTMPAAVRDLLGATTADEPRATVVRYQPEASVTVRLDTPRSGAPSVFAKHLADGTVADVAARHQSLWSRSVHSRGLRIAEPLAVDPVRRVLWTRGVEGRPLTESVHPDRLPAATEQLGPLLAALHASSVDTTSRISVDDLLVEARKKADKLVRAHPPISAVVTDLVATASTRRRDVARERVCTLHGDFHLDQLVASAAGPVLVDLDSMVHGPPEVDLAEFLVDLALRGLPAATTQDVARALLSSYAQATGRAIDAALLAVCADAEFVNRCYRHLRRHSPEWQSGLESELARHADLASLLLRA
jgi:hypothetical protein